MSVKILLDMNLSPDWVAFLQQQGWTAKHWSTVGDPKATDRTIMDWAEANQYIVFTFDLDFLKRHVRALRQHNAFCCHHALQSPLKAGARRGRHGGQVRMQIGVRWAA